MNERIHDLMNYLDSAHSVFHAVEGLKNILEENGYIRLQESGKWDLQPGGKYFMTRGGASIMAFRIPEGSPKGFMMSASHADRPCFKVKENGELVGKYTKLAVERYGGMLMGTWLDRPLSIAGRVLVETDKGMETRLVNIDRDLLLIPNVAIHMNRKANEGYAWNPAVDLLPLMGGADAKGKLNALLEEAAGGKIIGHDLYLYIRQKATIWGLEEAFLSSAALDDLECAYCCTRGFLDASASASVPVLCVFGSEEVGSSSVQGAASDLLENLLARICKACNWDLMEMLADSFMVSADNAHAVHPNHPELADPNNAPVMNGGIVVKFNASQRYTTDAVAAAVFRSVCKRADVPTQTYYNRPDIPGGSTLGYVSLTHVSVPTADIGLAQLAMHSCYETAGVLDSLYLEQAMTAYFSSTLTVTGDGEYIIV